MSTDEKVTKDLESVADAVFSGETIEGLEHLAAPQESAPESAAVPATKDEGAGDDAAAALDTASAEKKETADTPAAPDAAKPVDEAKKPDEAKKDDPAVKPIEDQEVPADIKGKTRERMDTLISRVKETKTELQTATTKLEEATAQLNGFRTMLDESGLSNDEVLQMLDIGTLIKRDPDQAFSVLQGIVKTMAKDLGKTVESVDLLEGHEDLQTRVTKLEISREDAELLAKARIKEARDNRIRQEQVQQDRSAQQTKDAILQAAGAVRAFLTEAEKDVDYPKISPLLVKAAKFAADNLDPSKWEVYIKDQHARIKETASLSREQRPDPKAAPITDKGSSGSMNRETKSLEDLAEVLL